MKNDEYLGITIFPRSFYRGYKDCSQFVILHSSFVKRLIQIPENIFDILQSNGQTNEIGADACGFLFFLRELGVGGAGRMNGKRLCVTEIGNMAEEFQVVDETRAGFTSAFGAEAEDRTWTFW